MNSKYNLFLDDVRKPSDVTWVQLPMKTYVVVKNYNQFREVVLIKGVPKFVAYDHDLSDAHYGHGLHGDDIPYDQYGEKTGYDCAKFLVAECQKLGIKHPPYVVHSMNPVGAANIISYISSYDKTVA